MSRDSEARVLDPDEMVRAYGRPLTVRVVFTNGVFDLLHRGHVACLEAARELGDVLVVALNSDASAARLKGEGRPFQSVEERAHLVAALRCVEAVTVFDTDTPAGLIRRLLPDVLVKGGDYAPDEVVGAEAVRDAGGTVRIVPLLPGYSTTKLAERIAARCR